MKKIILVRHGLTHQLVENRYQGWSDPSLNDEGKREVRDLVPRFEDLVPEVIFSSPLKRAKETAEILSGRIKLEISEDERIKEMNFGDWEGQTYEEITAKDPEAFEWWKKDVEHFCPKNGESVAQLRIRVRQFLDQILAMPADRIAIVTHGGVIRVTIVELLNLGLDFFWKIDLATASISILDRYTNRFVLSCLNWEPIEDTEKISGRGLLARV